MNVLKGFALGILGFLLFLSLSMLGVAVTLNYTILNPNFVVAELDKLDISSLVEESLSQEANQEEFPEELKIALVDNIDGLEPVVKEQVGTAIYQIYDYLLGKSQNLDLSLVLRETLLSRDFVASLIDKLDISTLAGEFLAEQLAENIPKEMEFVVEYADEYIDDVITELEPTIKKELIAAADPIADCLIGENRSFNIIISLGPVTESLGNTLREAFLESPPEELAGLPRAELEQYFNEYFGEILAAVVPSTFEINESMLGTEIPSQLAEALTEAEVALAQARQYVGYFQIGYKALIGFTVLVIIGIILLDRRVRNATRNIGITFLTVGVVSLIEFFLAKHFIAPQIAQPDIPVSLQTWLPQLLNDFLAPLQAFSIGLLVAGVVLLIVSFIYKPGQQSDESQ